MTENTEKTKMIQEFLRQSIKDLTLERSWDAPREPQYPGNCMSSLSSCMLLARNTGAVHRGLRDSRLHRKLLVWARLNHESTLQECRPITQTRTRWGNNDYQISLYRSNSKWWVEDKYTKW